MFNCDFCLIKHKNILKCPKCNRIKLCVNCMDNHIEFHNTNGNENGNPLCYDFCLIKSKNIKIIEEKEINKELLGNYSSLF